MAGRIVRGRLSCGCALCGALEVERDEVLDGGVLALAECTRCRHRWTERLLHVAPQRDHAELEVATAA